MGKRHPLNRKDLVNTGIEVRSRDCNVMTSRHIPLMHWRDAQETQPARKNLPRVPASLYMAQEVGEGLGQSSLLQ